jgi:hypothetical protein
MSTTPTLGVVRAWWLTAAALVCAGTLAYWNSFEGGFVDPDDYIAVRDNPHIRVLWPLRHALSLPLWGTQAPVSPRPVLSLSFALNYALLGPAPWGYHLVNLVIHLAAGILLFGVVRRTLASKVVPQHLRLRALPLAGAIAVLWLVHPLQTESVTYIVQRSESLAGLLMLAALYCAICGHTSARRGWWYAGAVLACVLGVGVKQHAAVMPVLILLHDAVFNDQRYRDALKQHWPLYAGLTSSWLVVAGLQWCARGEVIRDAATISPWRWALTQPEVILHYLRLCILPRPLVFQYYWPVAQSLRTVVLPVLLVGSLLATVLWAAARRRWYGFVGMWFFLILAPTSSIVPLSPACLCREHRLYLPLAAVLTLVVLGIDWAARRAAEYWRATVGWHIIPAAGVGALLLIYIGLTIERNGDYRSEVRIKLDSAYKRPQNWFAFSQAGDLLRMAGDLAAATGCYVRSLALQPTNVPAWYHLGVALAELGCYADALSNLHAGARMAPDSTSFDLRIAHVYLASGATNAARATYLRLLERDRSNQIARFHLARLPAAAPEPAQQRAPTAVRGGSPTLPPWRHPHEQR